MSSGTGLLSSEVSPGEQGPLSTGLPFLAAGRVIDAICLASCSHCDTPEQIEETEDIFRKMLRAAKLKMKPGSRTRLKVGDEGSVVVLLDPQGELLFFLVTSYIEYPEKYAYQLLAELMGLVKANEKWRTIGEGGLLEMLQPKMAQLMDKYEDLSNFDQYSKALSKMGTIKTQMNKNMAQVQANTNSAQELAHKSDDMAAKADTFNKTTKDVEWKYKMALLKEKIITYSVVVIILGGAGYLIVH